MGTAVYGGRNCQDPVPVEFAGNTPSEMLAPSSIRKHHTLKITAKLPKEVVGKPPVETFLASNTLLQSLLRCQGGISEGPHRWPSLSSCLKRSCRKPTDAGHCWSPSTSAWCWEAACGHCFPIVRGTMFCGILARGAHRSWAEEDFLLSDRIIASSSHVSNWLERECFLWFQLHEQDETKLIGSARSRKSGCLSVGDCNLVGAWGNLIDGARNLYILMWVVVTQVLPA